MFLEKSWLVVAALALSACSAEHGSGPGPATALDMTAGEGTESSSQALLDLRAVRAELLAADLAFAEYAKTVNLVEALVAPLADDAVFLAPGPGFAIGPQAARDVLTPNPANLLSKWTWQAIRGDVSNNGQHGYTYGYTELTLPNGAILPGKYAAYWKKQADGSWKMAAYRRAGRPAGPVSLTPPTGFETPSTRHRRYFPNTSSADVVAAIRAADVAFSDLAQVAGNGPAFGQYAAPDGAQTGGGASAPWVFGPAAIAAVHAPDPLGQFSWAPEIAAGANSGDLGFTIGYVLVPGGAIAGKYFTIWQRQDTDRWLYVVD